MFCGDHTGFCRRCSIAGGAALQAVQLCRRCGIAVSELVPRLLLCWYYHRFLYLACKYVLMVYIDVTAYGFLGSLQWSQPCMSSSDVFLSNSKLKHHFTTVSKTRRTRRTPPLNFIKREFTSLEIGTQTKLTE